MAIKAETGFSLKDDLFNKRTVNLLATNMAKVYPKFPTRDFCATVLGEFPNLELKARIDFMAEQLALRLPPTFAAQVKLLHKALPPPLDPNKTDNDFGAFIWSVPSALVAASGCNKDSIDLSLGYLEAATQRFSAEFAIRPFLDQFPNETLAYVQRWVSHPNYHVRRLASEGIRPFLPWAQRVLLPPTTITATLTQLHSDPTRFVTRSVANNLNDLTKTDPELVIGTLQQWHQQGKQQPAELAWMTNHALRTLVKQDHAAALTLLGYPTQPKFQLSGTNSPSTVTIGQSLVWRGQLKSLAKQKLRINLRVHFLKANGSHAAKVFAVKDLSMAKGDTLVIDKKLPIRPMTTRTLYPGTHLVELVVNGVSRGKRDFELVT